jgi:hypothetical protein
MARENTEAVTEGNEANEERFGLREIVALNPTKSNQNEYRGGGGNVLTLTRAAAINLSHLMGEGKCPGSAGVSPAAIGVPPVACSEAKGETPFGATGTVAVPRPFQWARDICRYLQVFALWRSTQTHPLLIKRFWNGHLSIGLESA